MARGMKATGRGRAREVLSAVTAGLAGLAQAATTPEAQLALIGELEGLKAAACAAQAVATARFAAARRAEQPARVPGEGQVDVIGRSIAAEIGLARQVSPHQAARLVGLARVLVEEMPHTLGALRTGVLNEWRATLLARETATLSRAHRGEVDAWLGADPERLRGWGDREIARQVAAVGYRLDPQAAITRFKLAGIGRTVTLRPTADGMTRLSALLPLRDGVAVWKCLNRQADAARAAGDARGRGQLMADTLTTRLTGDPGGTPDPTRWLGDSGPFRWEGVPEPTRGGGGGEADPAVKSVPGSVPGPVPPRLPVRLHLVMTDQTLLAGTGAALLEGEPLPVEAARDLLAGVSVSLRRVFTDPAGQLVALESASRRFPDGLAELIELRDRTCRTPWCDAPIRHHDHVVDHAEGGPTSYVNGQGLCEACNHAKQAPGWSHTVTDPARHEVAITTPTGQRHVHRPPPAPGTLRE